MTTLTLLVFDTYCVLSLTSSQNPDWFGLIFGGVMLNGLFIPFVIHKVIVLYRLSREDKRG